MNLPAHLFFASPEQRVALARKRFFEDGARPSGMVPEAVIQSWARCLRSHPDPQRAAAFEPVTPSRVHNVMRRNRQLLEAAGDELERLRVTLAGTSGTAMLTDAQGVVIGTSFTQARSHEQLMPVSTRLGVNLAEEIVGTTAPGITVRTGQASAVSGAEHYFGNVQTMHCAAAPIRDVQGQLAGVLDLSSEDTPFGFDAATVVAHYAAEIENRLLCAQSTKHVVVQLQISPVLLDTPLVALLGVTSDGCIDWFNAAASRLLGLQAMPGVARRAPVEDTLGLTVTALAAQASHGRTHSLHLPNGLTLWARCLWRAGRDGPRNKLHPAAAVAGQAEASATPAQPDAPGVPGATMAPGSSPTLRETGREAVVRAMAACGGNVSKAARLLGVSRGLIYRHLRPPSGAHHTALPDSQR